MKEKNKANIFQKVVIGGLENFFFAYGCKVSKHPFIFILSGIIFCALCMIGLMNFTEETDDMKLWHPSDSLYRKQMVWLAENFPPKARTSTILVYTDDNILEANNIKEIYTLRKSIDSIKTDLNGNWQTECERRPVASLTSNGAKSSKFPQEVCPMVNALSLLPQSCIESHIFEIWADPKTNNFNEVSDEIINALDDEDILNTINSNTITSGLSGRLVI